MFERNNNNASEPALSPDGSRLAFRGWGAYPEKYNDNRVDHPYYACPGPFAERMLGHTTLDNTDYFSVGRFWEDSHPDWSSDGSRILFDTGRNGDGITRIMAVSADGQREGGVFEGFHHPAAAERAEVAASGPRRAIGVLTGQSCKVAAAVELRLDRLNAVGCFLF